jgi:hypothetical protein
MTLSDLASIGSPISGVAVLMSLVYLSLQIRQTEKNQDALMQQGRANRVSEASLKVAEPAFTRIWTKGSRGDADLSAEEFGQFMNMCRAAFVSFEDSFLQHRSGHLNETAYRSFVAGGRSMLSQHGLRAAWHLSSHQYGDECVRFMDDLLQTTPPAPESDQYAQWLDIVRSEKPGTAGTGEFK